MDLLIVLGIVLLILSIVAYAMGASGVAGMTANVGKVLLFVGIGLFVLLLLLNFFNGHYYHYDFHFP